MTPVEASWDEAMDLITTRSKELLDSKGPLSHAFYTSGQLMLEEYYTLAVIGKAGIGTPHMDGNTRLCTATAAASLKESFDADGQPGSYADLDVCQALFCFGHNVAATQTHPSGEPERLHADGLSSTRSGGCEISMICICWPATWRWRGWWLDRPPRGVVIKS